MSGSLEKNLIGASLICLAAFLGTMWFTNWLISIAVKDISPKNRNERKK